MNVPGAKDPKSTNAIRLIAQEAIEQQARFCSAKMENIEKQVAQLVQVIKELAEKVNKLATEVAVLKSMLEHQRED